MASLRKSTISELTATVSFPLRQSINRQGRKSCALPTEALSVTASWRELAAGLAPVEGADLSPAERVVALQVAQGLTNREIARVLGKSEITVKHQVSSILAKLGVPSRTRLIVLLR